MDGDEAGQAGATLCGALSSHSPCVVVRRRKHIKSEGGRRGVDGDEAGQAGATLCGALSSPSPVWSCGGEGKCLRTVTGAGENCESVANT